MMKKTYPSTVLVLLMTISVSAEYGFFPDFFGDLTYRELSNPSNSVLIGTTMNQIGASDFGPDNQYYAISGLDDGLYVIDTEDGSATFIATVTPPGSEFWTGMALDPTEGTMYICSTDGSGNSFYTLDLADGTATLVGTNTAGDGVVGIAFDDSGQMYAIYLVREFYSIDKTDGSATFIGDLNAACTAFPHHGLDFDPETQTMYMVSYNAFTFDNELWTVDLSTAVNTLVGSVGFWTGTMAVEPQETLVAGFSVDNNEICAGESVSFTDESIGDPETWLWTFEGGTPPTSTEQNPVVTYAEPGLFDVTLEVTAGSTSNTVSALDYISVYAVPTPEISGDDVICQFDIALYSTEENTGSTYSWEVEGGTILAGAGTHEIEVQWEEQGNGQVGVTEDNGNCSGAATPMAVTVMELPSPEITGPAVVCEGDLSDYSTADNPGSTYFWEVAGCTVVSGAGTHQITVEWGEPGTGFVLVTEFDGDCAASTGPYEVVIEECTAIRETYGNVLFVYPNPTEDKLFFTIPGIQAGTVQVLDATGRILLHSGFDSAGNSAVEVDLSSLRPGIYFLRVTGPDGSKAMSKFIKTD